MRTLTCLLTILGLAVLASPDLVSATPSVTFKAKAVPIAGFPHTGNIFGAGATIEAEFKIAGNEYHGFAPPLIGMKVSLPTGIKLHTAGFPTCPGRHLIEALKPQRCPKGSSAGPPGKQEGFVVLGERVPETTAVQAFYAPGNNLNVVFVGRTPASIELVSTGHLNPSGGGFGQGAQLDIPPIQSVPGSAFASTDRFVYELGSAIIKSHKPRYLIRMPNQCLKRHLTFRAELTFAENGNPLTPVTVSKIYNAPCPRRSGKR